MRIVLAPGTPQLESIGLELVACRRSSPRREAIVDTLEPFLRRGGGAGTGAQKISEAPAAAGKASNEAHRMSGSTIAAGAAAGVPVVGAMNLTASSV